jgi:hypothetical protein
MSSSVTLLFEWTYKAYGEHHKKCFEYPATLTGVSKKTFICDSVNLLSDQFCTIKHEMVEYVKENNRCSVLKYWESEYGYEDEEISKETVKIFNVREATKWSDLDDY